MFPVGGSRDGMLQCVSDVYKTRHQVTCGRQRKETISRTAQENRFFCCFFPPSFFFFFFALVAVPWVTVQGVARSNKPASQAGLMFNEDDSQWLLITAMSPNTDTFNTARHSRCFCTMPGGLSTATYLHWCTYLHTHTHPQTQASVTP